MSEVAFGLLISALNIRWLFIIVINKLKFILSKKKRDVRRMVRRESGVRAVKICSPVISPVVDASIYTHVRRSVITDRSALDLYKIQVSR